MITSRFALTTLAASVLFSSSRVLAVDYTITQGATPLAVNGFNEASNSAELTMQFALTDGAGVGAANTACVPYQVDGANCNTGAASITAITLNPTLTVNDLSVGVDINLATIAASGAYSYDSNTKVGTLNFCTRCATSDPVAGEIDYAETLATVTVTMEENIPAITANVQETTATTDNKDAGAATYAVTAIQCDDAKAADTSTLAQGDYLRVCVSFAQAGVDCDHFETLDINTFGVVATGSIANAALTTGDVAATPSADGTCFIKTQFPSTLIPADGTAGTVSVSGAVVIHFGRRKLRVNVNTDEQRSLEVTNSDDATADFQFDASVQSSSDIPFEGTNSAAASGTTARAVLFGAAAALFLAV